MTRIMSDNDVRGHVVRLLQICHSSSWNEIWIELSIDVFAFDDLGLDENASDATVWRTCQEHRVLLITANRNAHGPESLEVTIRNENASECLPVLTLSNRDRIANDRMYAEAVVERLIEIIMDLENYRGAGRLFLP
jgi:hypothetical protein